MKQFFFFFTFSFLLVNFSACKKDPPQTDKIINYDGNNADSPSLPGGSYEASARFGPLQVDAYVGGDILSVQYFIYEVPNRCELVLYANDNGNLPGTELYRKDITPDVRANSWNTHALSLPVRIPSQGFWASIFFGHNRDQRTIGCDAGPANINGDWLFDSLDEEWMTYRDRTGESVNWNIRVVVSEP